METIETEDSRNRDISSFYRAFHGILRSWAVHRTEISGAGEIFAGIAGRHVKMHSWSPRESFADLLAHPDCFQIFPKSVRLGFAIERKRFSHRFTYRDILIRRVPLSQDFAWTAGQAIFLPRAISSRKLSRNHFSVLFTFLVFSFFLSCPVFVTAVVRVTG